jgi:hypothetical protein
MFNGLLESRILLGNILFIHGKSKRKMTGKNEVLFQAASSMDGGELSHKQE